MENYRIIFSGGSIIRESVVKRVNIESFLLNISIYIS